MEWILPDQKDVNLVDWIYQSRGIQKDNTDFFSPKLKNLHSPLLLHNVQKVADVLKNFIGTDKKIFIHGDFDVDGITATSIMWQFLYRDLKLNALPYIPSRFTEGYGLSEESINKIIESGGKLIITVDCGVKDIELIHKYYQKIDFIITDHHNLIDKNTKLKGGEICGDYIISKDALAVCHPKLSEYPFKELCGAAVAWKVCSAVNELLNTNIDLNKYLDLAAIGTVCDIMPLLDENRVIVKLGLEQLKKTNNIGIKTLIDYLKIQPNLLDTYHLGFMIGPRINATGRLEDAMDAVRLLTTTDPRFAQKMALKLDSLNTERQVLTQKYIELAEEQILKQEKDKLYFVYGNDWPEGIIGLIAGKLTEKYHRPVIAGSLREGKIKASARSIESFHIAENLNEHSTLLLTHGGHAQAAGLSLLENNLNEFITNIKEIANKSINKKDLIKQLKIDGIANVEDINLESYKIINALAPFGMGNKKPTIALLNVKPVKYQVFGKENNHLKVFIDNNNELLEVLGFSRASETDKINLNAAVDIAGTIEKNEWNGKVSTYLKIDDLKQS